MWQLQRWIRGYFHKDGWSWKSLNHKWLGTHKISMDSPASLWKWEVSFCPCVLLFSNNSITNRLFSYWKVCIPLLPIFCSLNYVANVPEIPNRPRICRPKYPRDKSWRPRSGPLLAVLSILSFFKLASFPKVLFHGTTQPHPILKLLHPYSPCLSRKWRHSSSTILRPSDKSQSTG